MLATYSQPGNIDRHDKWFQSARSFLAVNDETLERQLCAVAPKYRDELLANPRGRAAYKLIQEQLEVLKLAQRTLVPEVAPHASKKPSDSQSWVQTLDKSIEVKPSFFGMSINLKELLKAIVRAWKR